MFGSFLSIPVKRILDIINNAPENTLKFLKELPIDIKKLESMEAHEIEKILPGIFAADFTSNLGTNSRVCIFIDTYEAIWKDWRGVGSFSEKDKWIRKCLIPNMPGVSWVICGREQIKSRWAEDEKDYKRDTTGTILAKPIEWVKIHNLPAGVTDLSGIALDCNTNQAWVFGSGIRW